MLVRSVAYGTGRKGWHLTKEKNAILGAGRNGGHATDGHDITRCWTWKSDQILSDNTCISLK